MQNPMVSLVEKLSKMEEIGIYIEDINVSDRYKLIDDNPMTLTGTNRPAGEYYHAHLLVLVAIDQPEDDGKTLVEAKSSPEIQGIYVPVQDDIPTCKQKRFNRLNVATPIIRGDIISTEPKKEHNQSYREQPCKKEIKTIKKYPDDIGNVVSAKTKTRKRKAK